MSIGAVSGISALTGVSSGLSIPARRTWYRQVLRLESRPQLQRRTGLLEARIDKLHEQVCAAKIALTVPVRIGFRQYAEPATRTGPADAELLYERVIVFRPK